MIDAAIDDVSGEPYAVVEHVEGRASVGSASAPCKQDIALAWPA
ncbi:MAG: hypothetical protein R3B70_14345 [Polyangiaceae bacterium]